MKGALNDPILVDPQLVGQANRDAVRPADKPATGAVPVSPRTCLRISSALMRHIGSPIPGRAEAPA